MDTPFCSLRFYKIFLFPLSSFLLLTNLLLAGDECFQLTYSQNNSEASAAIESRTGGFIFCGSIDLVGHPDIYVVKTDPHGVILWESILGHPGDGDDTSSDLAELPDGRIVIVGTTDRKDLGPLGPGNYVLMLSPEGELLWEGTYGGSRTARKVIVTPEGTLAIIGSEIIDDDLRYSDPMLLFISEEGEILSKNTYIAFNEEYGVSVQLDPAGGFYLLSEHVDIVDEKRQIGFTLFKLDAQGEEVWQKIFPATERNKRPVDFRVTSDGDLIIASNFGISGTFQFDHLFTRLNSQGEMIWEKIIGTDGKDFVASLTEVEDGGIVFVGREAGQGWDALITKLNSEGELIWERIFGGPANDEFDSIIRTSDGGLLAAGLSGSFVPTEQTHFQAYLVRMNSEGESKDFFKQIFGRGDVNDDQNLDTSDVVSLLLHLFLDGASPPCPDAADVNDDGRINISDGVNLVLHLFQGRDIPLPHLTKPGLDPTSDNIFCR